MTKQGCVVYKKIEKEKELKASYNGLEKFEIEEMKDICKSSNCI